MELPKFKIGDKAQMRYPDRIITIDGIIKKGDEFFYVTNPDDPRYIREEKLFPYEEPKEKKLYAYRVLGFACEIKFFMGELTEDITTLNSLDRIPCYDIEYPQSK